MKKMLTAIMLLCLFLNFNFVSAEGPILETVNYEGIYDGNAHEGGAQSSVEGAIITYSTNNGQSWSGIKPSITNAGTLIYQVKAEMLNGETHFSEGKLTVTPLDVTVTITGKQGVIPYDGKSHSVEGYEAVSGSDLYRTEDIEFTGSATASRTEVGITDMGLSPEQFSNKNPNFNVSFIVNDGYQRITTKNEVVVTIVGHHNTAIFNGHEHSVNGYDIVSISNNLYREDYFDFMGRADARRMDVGTSYMGLKSDDFVNRNGKFSEVIFSVTDGYQEIIAPFESSVDAIISHTNNVDGSKNAPYDLESNILSLMAVIFNDTEEYSSETISVDTRLLIQNPKLTIKFKFFYSLPDLYSGHYSVDIYGIPDEMNGTERAYNFDPTVKHHYFLKLEPAFINADGKIEIPLLWEEDILGYFGDPNAETGLPEDEIGAYSINSDGEKEYVLFHTFAICMNYLGDEELCNSGGRTYNR